MNNTSPQLNTKTHAVMHQAQENAGLAIWDWVSPRPAQATMGVLIMEEAWGTALTPMGSVCADATKGGTTGEVPYRFALLHQGAVPISVKVSRFHRQKDAADEPTSKNCSAKHSPVRLGDVICYILIWNLCRLFFLRGKWRETLE